MTQDVAIIKSLFDKAKEVLVLLPQNPGPDSIAASLSLFIGLEKTDKQISIACGTPIDFSQYPLKSAGKISEKIGNKNLVVSLKVDNRDSIDKVSYNLDEATKIFNLIITPKKGAAPLSSDSVSYSLAGARADLIFIVGASSFDDLGTLYRSEPALFTDTPTVAINRIPPTPFASHHIANVDASSISEFMVTVIESLGLSLDSDLSTNLLAAIDVVTDKLQLANVSASTFEAVAKLIRAGGTRIMLSLPQNRPSPQVVENVSIAENQSIESFVEPITEDIPQDWLSPKIYQAPRK
jgi:nanoRNase/pAp phosphatase (c-di-AMP/oligoRNAs hydrolase)